MRGFQSRLMFAAVVAYVTLRILSIVSADVAASIWRSQGPDVLAPLVLIPLFTWLQVLWGLRSPRQEISGGEIVLYVVAFSLIYEAILPAVLPHVVGDRLDVAAYCLGGALLWWIPQCAGRLRRAASSVASLHLRTAGSRR